MAVPENVTPVYNQVIISVYNFAGTGFGIGGMTPSVAVGSVYKIGSNVYRIAVNTKVGFLNITKAYFVTSENETFAVVDQDDVLIKYQP